MLISSSIPNMLNGVSQQPPSVRSRSQAQVQENALSSPARGLEKRPPTRHLAKLTTTHGGNAFVHTIKYSTEEMYTLIVNSSGLHIYDKNGSPKTLTGATGLPAYFSGVTNFGKEVAAVTAADTTILVNKTKTCLMDSTKSPARDKEALVYIKQGDFNLTYRVSLAWSGGSFTASYNTPDGSSASMGGQANSTYIVSQLVSQLNTLGSGFSFTNLGSTIYIKRTTGDFSVTVEDGRGGQFIMASKGSVRKFVDLPNSAPDGFTIRVNANAEDDRDEYYVKYEAPDGTTSAGVWVETVAPDTFISFDETTMPHKILKNPDGTFTFSVSPWEDMKAGDSTSIAPPSFINNTINDVFFYRNRMGFLSGENVIFSEVSEFFNFWPTTAIQLLDSDPIDVAVSNVRPSILRHAVPFNESLVLFSNLTQFVLTTDQILTPKTVAIDVATNFEASLEAKPAPAGRYVYFATKLGSWAGLREYYVDSANAQKDAADVTGHIPNYIKGTLTRLTASSNEDMLLGLADSEPNSLFVYKWYWKGAEKMVSSWSKWTFSGAVRGVEMNASEIYLLIEYSDGLYLEKIVLTQDDAANDMSYSASYVGGGAVLLDRRVKITSGTVPYPADNVKYVAKSGRVIPAATVAAQIAADGFVYAGVPYTFKYEFSEQFVMANEQAVTSGILTLKDFKVTYANTGYFRAEVELEARGTSYVDFTGSVLGSAINFLGTATLESGTFRIPVNTRSKYAKVRLTSDSYLPCAFQSADWKGIYIAKATRM